MAPCEIHTFLPISTWPKLSIHTFSPIQEKSPMDNFHGYLMLMDGFNTTPFPIFAPNSRRRAFLIPDPGFSGLMKNSTLVKYQINCLNLDAPISRLNQSLLYCLLETWLFIQRVANIFQKAC